MPSISYKPCIDGLRALAVLGVVFYHFGIGFSGGYVGVDVFFVISGYLITLSIQQHQTQNCFGLKDFWLRRIRRVLPALTLVVLSSLLLGYFILIPYEYMKLAESAVASMTFSANIYFWHLADFGYFSDLADFNPLLHIWSLAIEEQFYLLLPLVFFLASKIPTASVTRILIFTGVLSFGLSCWAALHKPGANFFLLPTRAWELAAGCLIALQYPKPILARWVSEITALVGFLMVLSAMTLYSKLTIFPGWTAIPPVLGTCFFLYANHSRKTVIGKLLSYRPIVFFGLISYSLYLWHWPVLSFSKHLFIDLNLTLRWILLGGVLLISVVSWKYVEQPFLKNPALSAKRMLLPSVIGGCVLIMALSWMIIRNNGFGYRFTPAELQLQADFEKPALMLDDSFKPYTFGDQISSQKPTLALWGDSHAAFLVSAFDKHCQKNKIQGVAFVKGGSIPVTGVFTDVDRELQDYNQQAMNYILNQPNIQHVILVSRWSLYINGQNAAELALKPFKWEPGLMEQGDQLEKLSVQHSMDLLTKHLESMASTLNNHGITLWLIEQVPESNNVSIAREFYLRKKYPALNPDYDEFGVSLADHLFRQKNAKKAISDVSDGLIKVIDPTPLFFNGNDRLRVSNERAYYSDDDHLTQSGVEYYLDDLVAEIIQKIALEVKSNNETSE